MTSTGFSAIPGRVLLDTCILNLIQDEGEYLFDGYLSEGVSESDINEDLSSLRQILLINQRASFQFFVSPLTFSELANAKDIHHNWRRITWALEMVDYWLTILDETGDRVGDGGSVRHRLKLTEELQELEHRLMENQDFRRDPIDRLLLIQYKMGNCDAFVTTDRNTIWRHRDWLLGEGIRILSPSDYWELLEPYARIWC